jgi:hypothetical protein
MSARYPAVWRTPPLIGAGAPRLGPERARKWRRAAPRSGGLWAPWSPVCSRPAAALAVPTAGVLGTAARRAGLVERHRSSMMHG